MQCPPPPPATTLFQLLSLSSNFFFKNCFRARRKITVEEEEEDVGRQREREKGRRIRGEVHNTTKRGGGAIAAEKRGSVRNSPLSTSQGTNAILSTTEEYRDCYSSKYSRSVKVPLARFETTLLGERRLFFSSIYFFLLPFSTCVKFRRLIEPLLLLLLFFLCRLPLPPPPELSLFSWDRTGHATAVYCTTVVVRNIVPREKRDRKGKSTYCPTLLHVRLTLRDPPRPLFSRVSVFVLRNKSEYAFFGKTARDVNFLRESFMLFSLSLFFLTRTLFFVVRPPRGDGG